MLFIFSQQEEQRTNEFFVRIVYSGKLKPSQVVCTPRSKRCKIGCTRKTFGANDIQKVYRVMQNQRNVVNSTSG